LRDETALQRRIHSAGSLKKSGNVSGESGTFLRQEPKPELGSPPEYVVGILRPFLFDQVVDLA
jgi:hypothetical protein